MFKQTTMPVGEEGDAASMGQAASDFHQRLPEGGKAYEFFIPCV